MPTRSTRDARNRCDAIQACLSAATHVVGWRPPVPTSQDGAYFDRWIDDHGDFNPFTDRGWRTIARRFLDASGGRSGLRILEVGCGTGQSLQIYAASARRHIGLDLSGEAVRRAARAYPTSAWMQADATRLPLASGSVDVVAFSSVLHHLPDMPATLREAVRVAVPGGLIFAFDPNLLHPAMLLFRHPRSPLYLSEGVSPDEQPLLPARLREAFAAAGIGAVRQRCQSAIPYRRVGPRLLNAVLPLYNLLDTAWEYSGAARWFGTFVITSGHTPRT